jgi:predicted ATPase/class 3 adenylate cyclase
MQQVAEWLEQIGMSEYGQSFVENAIDFNVLPDLTDQDLDKLGVLLGHRRKLLRAIAKLDDSSATPPSVPAPASQPPAVSTALPTSEASGQRRHVNVMFCDLVDSTGIAARLDAEDWRDLLNAYLDAASAAITEMGGTIARRVGDGLLALFGYPVAQENDAERAVHAALSIQRALAELNRKNEGAGKSLLAARIAIDSGSVVIDTTGEIFGNVPNIAARAQALAEPGSAVVTARVQRQIAGLFVVEELGRHELKGVPEPVTLYRIVRASGGKCRAGQRHLTPLFGREEEIAMLMRGWKRARQGDGQLVLSVGEPGLGKSRLIEEFHARLRDTEHTWVEWGCSQLLQNRPLHPIAAWGRMRFGGADVPTEQRLADLENSLTQVEVDPAENIPLLAPLLDIPLQQELTPILMPEELRRRQLAALTAWVLAWARAYPVVLALEDVHWADPTTLEILRGIAERGVLAPLFVLITARPEFRPPWEMRSHHRTIALAPLDRWQVQHMVGKLAGRHTLTQEVIDGVTERAGGVPLFVEEVTRCLLEREAQGGVQAIPPTLQQSLTARLDRLGSAREVAQIGAVIGRDFSYALLRAVARMEDAPLQLALDRLADADILHVKGLPPNADYRFKHALIQDAAYENLLKSRRQLLHRRVGEALRDGVVGNGAREPELLAHHFTQAGLSEAAVEWWGKAGHGSLERSALVEATEQFTRALSEIATLPSTPALRRDQINFQVALITPLIHIKGYAAPETKAAAERANFLIEQAEAQGEPLDDPLQLFSVLYGIWVANFAAFNGPAVRELGAQLFALAEKRKINTSLMIGHRIMGLSLLCTGNIEAARTHLDHALALYDATEHRLLATRFGQDIEVATLSNRSMTLWMLGYPIAALADVEKAVTKAREIGQAATLIYALSYACFTTAFCGEYAKAIALLDEVVHLAEEKGILYWKAIGIMDRGWVLALTGKASDAAKLLGSGITLFRSGGSAIWLPAYLSHLAMAHAGLGQFEDAGRCIGEALTTIETTGERWFEAEVCRIAGLIAQTKTDITSAHAYFERALTVARAQRAKSWELRAAMSLARLWRDQGKRGEARELLAPVHGWFTEGFDTRDLKEAKTLLDGLS